MLALPAAAAAPKKAASSSDKPDAAAEMRGQHPSADEINAAELTGDKPNRAALTRAEILLDRARYSPGVIDGTPGENVEHALQAYKKAHGLADNPALDPDTFKRLLQDDNAPALVDYTITEADAAGPYTRDIPAKMEDQAKLDRLGYHGPEEMLSERFHMDEAFLKELNKGKDFGKAGTVVKVANVARELDPTDAKAAGKKIAETKRQQPDRSKVARIVVDKPGHSISAFDKDGHLLGFYPASIGSTDKPAPSGTLQVVRVAANPGYTYNPDYAFKGVKARKAFEIKPGPNNPVGAVWIQLTGEGYGIHGTPEPDKVGKSASHGCVRLTNWNALELASMVDKGVTVEFGE
jgi:lipoprotein-anchoring transpeptidase ErfK/SrfK